MWRSSVFGFIAAAALGVAASKAEVLTEPSLQYRFSDAVWTPNRPRSSEETLAPRLPRGPQCLAAGCDEIGNVSAWSDERLSSYAGGLPGDTYLDANGHRITKSGLVVLRGRAPNVFGLDQDDGAQAWVGGEITFDPAGSHSWFAVHPNAASEARLFPVEAFRFEGQGLGALVEGVQVPTSIPEPAVWRLMALGFVALALWSIAKARKTDRSFRFAKHAPSQSGPGIRTPC
jgi:hypothetical protein